MYVEVLRTATWPRRSTVSRGSLTKRATDEAQNLATEKVVGDTRLSIRNRVRRTRGVERVSRGWISECRIVGRTSGEGQT